jgi:hypothetical protein
MTLVDGLGRGNHLLFVQAGQGWATALDMFDAELDAGDR